MPPTVISRVSWMSRQALRYLDKPVKQHNYDRLFSVATRRQTFYSHIHDVK